MTHKIIEIKARCADHPPVRAKLNSLNARVVGEDHQVDTYFRVPEGRLKLREGTIERSLIRYRRPNQAGPKRSDVTLQRLEGTEDARALKQILTELLGVLVVVDKRREIFFVDNVKVHLDRVDGLGEFLEIEAIDDDNTRTVEQLQAQCEELMDRFGVTSADLIDRSYSDLLLEA